VSRVVVPTNGAGKTTLPFLLSSSLLGVFGGSNPFLCIRIFLFVPFLFSFKLLRILWLRGLYQIHLRGLRGDFNSLSISARSRWGG
jgi:hypothetical protein